MKEVVDLLLMLDLTHIRCKIYDYCFYYFQKHIGCFPGLIETFEPEPEWFSGT